VVAPEYYFRLSPAQAVKKRSKSYFGTNSDGTVRLSDATLTHFAGRKSKHTMYGRSDRDLLLIHLCEATRGRNVLVVAGTMFWTEREPVIARGLLGRERITAKGLVRNTMHIVYRGSVVKTYHKQVNSHELESFEPATHTFAGGHTDGTFEVGGLSIGAEVCADHTASSSNLRARLISRANPSMTNDQAFIYNKLSERKADGTQGNPIGLDVQILVSDGMPMTIGSVALRKGGVFIHCDTRIPQTVQVSDPQTGALAVVPPLAPGRWQASLAAPAAQKQAFQAARASLQANLRPPTT
jgi:hypothetical protein